MSEWNVCVYACVRIVCVRGCVCVCVCVRIVCVRMVRWVSESITILCTFMYDDCGWYVWDEWDVCDV